MTDSLLLHNYIEYFKAGFMNYIMIIDDSPTVRKGIGFTIQDMGYEIMEANNGLEGLKKIEELKSNNNGISLCFVDINMPVMDGLTFIKEFRKTDRFTPVVVITTEANTEIIKEGKKAGASAWILKPFKPDNVIDTVKKLAK